MLRGSACSRPVGSAASIAARSAGSARRRGDVGHLVRPRGARPGRRWSSSAPARRRSWTCPATLEYLETHGVPVVAVGQAELPGFYARSSGAAVAAGGRRTSPVPPQIAAAHLELGLGGGIVICVPVPADVALPGDVAREDAVERAIREADAAGDPRPATDALAAGPDRRDDRRRLGPCEHRADRQRRRAVAGRIAVRRPLQAIDESDKRISPGR